MFRWGVKGTYREEPVVQVGDAVRAADSIHDGIVYDLSNPGGWLEPGGLRVNEQQGRQPSDKARPLQEAYHMAIHHGPQTISVLRPNHPETILVVFGESGFKSTRKAFERKRLVQSYDFSIHGWNIRMTVQSDKHSTRGSCLIQSSAGSLYLRHVTTLCTSFSCAVRTLINHLD